MTMAESLYQHYVGHCPQSGVYLIQTASQELALSSIQTTDCLHTEDFLPIYFNY